MLHIWHINLHDWLICRAHVNISAQHIWIWHDLNWDRPFHLVFWDQQQQHHVFVWCFRSRPHDLHPSTRATVLRSPVLPTRRATPLGLRRFRSICGLKRRFFLAFPVGYPKKMVYFMNNPMKYLKAFGNLVVLPWTYRHVRSWLGH